MNEERKNFNKASLVMNVFVFVVAFLMISTVTALPYTQGDGIRNVVDAQTKLEKILESRVYKRLKNLVEPTYNKNYDETQRAYVTAQLQSNVLSKLPKDDPLYPGIVEFLNTIAQVMLLLFGHNEISYAITFGIVVALAGLMSVMVGIAQIPQGIALGISIVIDALRKIITPELINEIGIIGVALLCIILSPLAFVLLLASIPGGVIVMIITCFIDTMEHVIIKPLPPVNHPPNQPSNPFPVNNSIVDINMVNLTWSGGDPDGDPVTYDIYFGPSNPPLNIESNISSNTYNTGTLYYQTTYYWKIVAWDNHSASNESHLWSFITPVEPPHNIILVWGIHENPPDPNNNFTAISGGGFHSLGLKENGSIVAWGDNDYGQCNVPSSNTNFIAISGGDEHSLGLKNDGSIVAWGLNHDGQCNIPEPNTDFIAISAGCSLSLGLKENGSVVVWGLNDWGLYNVPTPNTNFIAISTVGPHCLGLKANGSIVAWGRNQYNQCTIPPPNTNFIAIAAGGFHSLGLKINGSIVAWGNNENNQCSIPEPNRDFIKISAGGWHNLGLKDNGSVIAWGLNDWGQCNVPSPNTNFIQIAAGGFFHSLAIKAN